MEPGIGRMILDEPGDARERGQLVAAGHFDRFHQHVVGT